MSLDPLIQEGWIIASHAVFAFIALGLGIWQMLGAKGTTRHRVVGYIWGAAMVAVAFGSFWIHTIRIIGPFSPIHLLSAYTLFTVPLAIRAARQGRINAHRRAMQSIFWLALIVTGAFTLIPGRAMHAVFFGGQ